MRFQKVGIIGAGTMGSGIATTLAQKGVSVLLVDSSVAAANAGKEKAIKFYQGAVKKGKMSEEDAAKSADNIGVAGDLKSLILCDLVIEAIFEEYSVKAKLLRELDGIVASTTVVATNTSALTVSGLADNISTPSRFLGLHYFNPAAVNPIVEVVRGAQTSDVVYQKALDFIEQTGKTPLACKDSYGFAINRFFVPYGNEAMRLIDEGIGTMPQIDRVAKQTLHAPAGPFQVMNLVKPKIMYNAQKNLNPHGDFYSLASGLADIANNDHEFDLTGSDSGSEEQDKIIADRLMMACFIPVLQAIDEAVAVPQAFDLGAKLALKFGVGPVELMNELGQDKVQKLVEMATAKYGIDPVKSLAKVGSL
ncbi:MAG: 3-hydroxyacyl-CoA dehydrogenase family protein [Alphaproteobacteria bacterium]